MTLFDDDTCCGPVGEHPPIDALVDPASRWDETYNTDLQAGVVEGPARTGRVRPGMVAPPAPSNPPAAAAMPGLTLAPGCATINRSGRGDTPRLLTSPTVTIGGGGVSGFRAGDVAEPVRVLAGPDDVVRQLQRRNAELVREVEFLRRESRFAADMARAAQDRADDYLTERDDALARLQEADDALAAVTDRLAAAVPGVAS